MSALSLKQEYPKALSRAAICSFHVKDYNQCIELCDKFLNQIPTDNEIIKLRTNAVAAKVRNINKYIFKCKFRL